MRRVLPVLLLALTLSSLPGPAAAEVDAFPFLVAGQNAFGDWTVWDGDRGTWYIVDVYRGIDPQDGVVTKAAIGKGTCERDRDGRSIRISCHAKGRSYSVPDGGFEMDPLLESARLRLRAGGYTHTVRWTAQDGAPSVGGAPYADVDPDGFAFVGADAAAARYAPSVGRLFGHRVKTSSWFDFSDLVEGAFAGCVVFSTEPGPGERVRVSRTYETAR